MQTIATDRVAWSVCLSVGLSVTTVNSAKAAEPVVMPFRSWKGKERKSIYIAPFCTKVHTKRSGMDHTVLPANNTMPAFPS